MIHAHALRVDGSMTVSLVYWHILYNPYWHNCRDRHSAFCSAVWRALHIDVVRKYYWSNQFSRLLLWGWLPPISFSFRLRSTGDEWDTQGRIKLPFDNSESSSTHATPPDSQFGSGTKVKRPHVAFTTTDATHHFSIRSSTQEQI
jgi:hypothetical protein